jgi:hypothetical protein
MYFKNAEHGIKKIVNNNFLDNDLK